MGSSCDGGAQLEDIAPGLGLRRKVGLNPVIAVTVIT